MHERRHIPRADYPVFVDDRLVGEVTSGPSHRCSARDRAGVPVAGRRRAGRHVEVDIRGRRGKARSCAAVRGSQTRADRPCGCPLGAAATMSGTEASPKLVCEDQVRGSSAPQGVPHHATTT
jgi:hypothetical protein